MWRSEAGRLGHSHKISSFSRWTDYGHHKTWLRRPRNHFPDRMPLIPDELFLQVWCLHEKPNSKVPLLVTCCFLYHQLTYSVYSPRAHAPLMPLFSNPQFSGLNTTGSGELELEWGNWTGMGETRQNKSLWTNPQSDSQGPEGSSESWREIRESFGWVSPRISACVAGRGRLRGQTDRRDPVQPGFLCAVGSGGTGCLCCFTLSWPSVCGLHLTLQITLAL